MVKRTGTDGDDDLLGSINNDTFDAFQGGADLLNGRAGNDLFRLGAFFASGDRVRGGDGIDTLELDGNYASQLTIDATMLTGVERIRIVAGNNYNLAFGDGVIASGQSLTIDARAISSGNALEVNGRLFSVTSSDTTLIIRGGGGLTRVQDGFGTTILQGGDGQEIAYAGLSFTSSDRFDGGGGTADFFHFNGNLSAGLTVTGAMLANFEQIYFDSGGSYNVTFKDSVIKAGQQLQITAGGLFAGQSLILDASQETDGSVYIYDGQGDDYLKGSANNDYLQGANGGVDKLFGMGGDDDIQMGDKLTAADRINGGAGDDELYFSGDYSAGLVFDEATVKNMEFFYFNPGSKIDLTIADGTIAAGQLLTITGGNLGQNDWVIFDGSQETDGRIYISGGEGSDTITCGAGDDILSGYLQRDILTGGAGGDTFRFFGVLDSRGNNLDHITDFNAAVDRFAFDGTLPAPNAVDAAVTTGTLNAATFLSDIAAALQPGQFKALHAVIFTASSGDLAGHSYLAVGGNGQAGFQATGDLLIDITGATNLSSFSIDNFI